MFEFLAHIVVTAFLLFVVGKIVSGIEVRDAGAALWGALVLGIANGVVRPILVFLTLPLTIITLGLFLLVVNAVMLMIAASFVSGFKVRGFGSALAGSILLSLLNLAVTAVF
ncbi:MAG: phage holin family protein [Gemmatimonadota bacterium]|nr:phage holin family protein [Gemmatimonadota bacterium]MDH4351516.1 phage holin family protein [Gemmatimonadota bacterium]